MGTLGKSVYAAMLVMFVEKDRITPAFVRQICDALRRWGYLLEGPERMFRGQEHADWLTKKMERVADGEEWSLEVYWEAPGNGVGGNSSSVQYVMNRKNPDQLQVDDFECFRVYTIRERMPPIEGPKTGIMVETLKDVVKIVKPRFALLDVHHEVISKRKGKDPRRFAWGAMYYDAAHAKAIGTELLHNCAAVIKEEWPEGGWWIQAWANPFIVAPELTDQIALDLGLKAAQFPATASAAKLKTASNKRR